MQEKSQTPRPPEKERPAAPAVFDWPAGTSLPATATVPAYPSRPANVLQTTHQDLEALQSTNQDLGAVRSYEHSNYGHLRTSRRSREPQGYHELTEKLLGRDPSLASFRRFGSLNMLNLLSLQAELTLLKRTFEQLSAMDDQGPGKAAYYSQSFETMLNYPPGERPEQWRLLMEIRAKLKEYSTPLWNRS